MLSNQLGRVVKQCKCGYSMHEMTRKPAMSFTIAEFECPQCEGTCKHYLYVDERNLPDE